MYITKHFSYYTVFFSILFFVCLTVGVKSIDCTTDPKGTKSELERHIELCKKEIEEEERKLSQKQVERTETEAQIQLIDYNLSKKKQEIKKKDQLIFKLDKNIDTEEYVLLDLQKKLQTYVSAFKILMRKSNESENYDITDLLINNSTITDFFSKTLQHYQIQAEIQSLVTEIELIKKRINLVIDDLDIQKSQQETIRIQKRLEKEEIGEIKESKKEVLVQQLNQENQITSSIEGKKKQIRKIRNSILSEALPVKV